MPTFLHTVQPPAVDVRGARILCATAVPGTDSIAYATDAPEIIISTDKRRSTESFARGIASARFSSFDKHSLPEQRAVLLALIDTHGLKQYSYPSLSVQNGSLAEQLQTYSKSAHIFSVDSLGSDVVTESFRVAVASNNTVQLLDVNPAREKVTLLGKYAVDDRLVAVAFSEMTIVASTSRLHFMLRISRGGGLAVAATVPRSERPRRVSTSAVGEGSAAVVSFFGGLFARRDLSLFVPPSLAFALPDNQWLLSVDGELVTYSSFGAKLTDMEHVFKSKAGMDTSEVVGLAKEASLAARTKTTRSSNHAKSSSVSSFGSVATGVSHISTMSHQTFKDQTRAPRAEKPPTSTVFSSPFVLSVAVKNELMAFAANGSVPGLIDQIPLVGDDSVKDNVTAKIIVTRHGPAVATAYWPDGKVITVELVDDLSILSEKMEVAGDLRLALALVPADHIDRMIELRRALAKEARQQDWHDAAMQHFQVVINLTMRLEGMDHVDLVAEAIKLRGARKTSWEVDLVTTTLWADFLFRLRRRVMRPSDADVDVLETLCRADESATRVKLLLGVKHGVPLHAGEALITANECTLREEERGDALVALYTSLEEHGKALVLIENSNMVNSFDGVVSYLSTSMRAVDDTNVFFEHLKWVAHRESTEAQGRVKLERLIREVILDVEGSEEVMGRLMEVLVEEVDELALRVIEEITTLPSTETSRSGSVSIADVTSRFLLLPSPGEQSDSDSRKELISADLASFALLSGMAKAKALQKNDLFEWFRKILNDRILHSNEACYHPLTLLGMLQTQKFRILGLHEEQAFLLGQQGRHEAAADELAAEGGLSADEALGRLQRMLPVRDKASAGEALATAYVRVSAEGRANRIIDAANVVRSAAGMIEMERLLQDARCRDDDLNLKDMWPLLKEGLITSLERARLAEVVRAMRRSEVWRLREQVIRRRRRFVIVSHDRACTLCTRRIGDSVFAVYPDGTIAHLACHMSRESR